MNVSLKQTSVYKHPPLINFFRLRPELSWFLVCFILLLSIVLNYKWIDKPAYDESNFRDVPFEMVELKIRQQQKAAEPEIVAEEKPLEENTTEENKELKFGNDTGKWDIALGRPPQPLYTSMPPYPKAVKNAGIEGKVIIELGISETGKIIYGKIVKPLHPVLDRIVIEWIRKQRFTAAIGPDGNTFKSKVYLPILFKLIN